MDKPPFSGEQFDALLRHALLEKENLLNENSAEALAQQVFHSSEAAPDDPKTLERLTKNFSPRKFNFNWNVLVVSLLVAAAAVVAFVSFTSSKTKSPVAQKNSVHVAAPRPNENQVTIPHISSEELVSNPVPRKNPAIVPVDSAEEEVIDQIVAQPEISTPKILPPQEKSFSYDDIPLLTEAQEKQCRKNKLKILRDIAKYRSMAYLPMGKTKVDSVMRRVNGFYIGKGEVTNLEYNTFLTDLLMQGLYDQYLAARPAHGGWSSVGLPEFEEVYATGEAYNDFPAVNMTRKGAELYCEWLTKSMAEAITKGDVKWYGNHPPEFRLPCNTEWIYAARGGDSTIQFPWGHVCNSVQNVRGCYLCNFNYSLSKEKVGAEGPRGKNGCLSDGPKTHAVVTTAGRAIDTLVTAPVFSYNPNSAGAYCMLGNVSEMVWTWNAENPLVKGPPRAMGGSWYSSVENVLIEAPEQYNGVTEARPYIGFRVVMVQ